MTTAVLGPSAPAAEPPSPTAGTRREYIALAVLLVGTAIAYLCNLSANGWANTFYAAAAQAGSVSWQAFLFGSSDGGNSITVDKTPAALWPMALSIRLFGLSSWSLLIPQVLMGVGAVALLWATVRRTFGGTAGLLAGLTLALTPVAALMFRFDNPDALLVLLMVAAAWALTRAVEDGRTCWLVLCGLFVGFGFLAKQLQVMLVVPALALTYLIAGPPRLGVRIAQLLAAGVGVLVGAGWWVLIAELWPTDARPYFGGSPHNSILELTLGYNGLGRLNGEEFNGGGPGGHRGGGPFSEGAGITRLFQSAVGGQIAWLLPAALVLLIAGIILCGRATRTDRRRAAYLLWGGWLVVTGLVFSFMRGIFHQYYTVALSPALAALIGFGSIMLWRNRERRWVRLTTAVAVGLTVATAWLLLSRTASFLPWLRWVVLIAGIAVTIALPLPASRRGRPAIALTAVAVCLAGPLTYTVETLAIPHTGPIPMAGPKVPMHFGPGFDDPGQSPPCQSPTSEPVSGSSAAGPQDDRGPGSGQPPAGGTAQRCHPPGAGPGFFDSRTSAQVVRLLAENGGAYTWAAATVGSMTASGYQLATQLPVMPIGGFSGHDPSPTPEQFYRYVAEGRIHYFIVGGEHGREERRDTSYATQITEWVREYFTPRVVDGVTVYDLTQRRTT
ncbi:glycosyltransferase family 39 protein [Nocardia sp. CDC159]|uniref:Glycosyltransferase family 39 protein n=1 Tax=Nocardia pulmonis TaxID=2951408 RepID=A0A9X2EE55_9NOCA|nr:MULTISPECIES: glycosyltransferase family 39 protein [Nocardia]MCM6777378.1 glycosyltransferase family 39 protein [Nocardia pulmonis]MCM6790263.1 glycosyltransferase family 39 protein [Nocardia sp. CDC159]